MTRAPRAGDRLPAETASPASSLLDPLGIPRTTFRVIRERDAEVASCHERGTARAVAHVANGLLQKARAGDTTSMIFYLKTQAGWRETATVEHSGAVQTTGARDRLTRLIDRIAERRQRIGVPPGTEPGGGAISGTVGRGPAGEAETHTASIPTGGRRLRGGRAMAQRGPKPKPTSLKLPIAAARGHRLNPKKPKPVARSRVVFAAQIRQLASQHIQIRRQARIAAQRSFWPSRPVMIG